MSICLDLSKNLFLLTSDTLRSIVAFIIHKLYALKFAMKPDIIHYSNCDLLQILKTCHFPLSMHKPVSHVCSSNDGFVHRKCFWCNSFYVETHGSPVWVQPLKLLLQLCLSHCVFGSPLVAVTRHRTPHWKYFIWAVALQAMNDSCAFFDRSLRHLKQ